MRSDIVHKTPTGLRLLLIVVMLSAATTVVALCVGCGPDDHDLAIIAAVDEKDTTDNGMADLFDMELDSHEATVNHAHSLEMEKIKDNHHDWLVAQDDTEIGHKGKGFSTTQPSVGTIDFPKLYAMLDKRDEDFNKLEKRYTPIYNAIHITRQQVRDYRALCAKGYATMKEAVDIRVQAKKMKSDILKSVAGVGAGVAAMIAVGS